MKAYFRKLYAIFFVLICSIATPIRPILAKSTPLGQFRAANPELFDVQGFADSSNIGPQRGKWWMVGGKSSWNRFMDTVASNKCPALVVMLNFRTSGEKPGTYSTSGLCTACADAWSQTFNSKAFKSLIESYHDIYLMLFSKTYINGCEVAREDLCSMATDGEYNGYVQHMSEPDNGLERGPDAYYKSVVFIPEVWLFSYQKPKRLTPYFRIVHENGVYDHSKYSNALSPYQDAIPLRDYTESETEYNIYTSAYELYDKEFFKDLTDETPTKFVTVLKKYLEKIVPYTDTRKQQATTNTLKVARHSIIIDKNITVNDILLKTRLTVGSSMRDGLQVIGMTGNWFITWDDTLMTSTYGYRNMVGYYNSISFDAKKDMNVEIGADGIGLLNITLAHANINKNNPVMIDAMYDDSRDDGYNISTNFNINTSLIEFTARRDIGITNGTALVTVNAGDILTLTMPSSKRITIFDIQ